MKSTLSAEKDALLLPKTLKPFKTLAWALLASLLIHALGFTALQAGGTHANEPPDGTFAEHVLQASLIPATLIESPTLSALTPPENPATATTAAAFTIQTASPATAPTQTPPLTVAPKPASPEPVHRPEQNTAPLPISSDSQALSPTTVAQPNSLAPIDIQTATLTSPGPIVTAPASLTRPTTPEVAQGSPYRLPNQLTVRFEANSSGVMGKSVLSWKKTSDLLTQTTQYDAQLSTTATVFFKTFEHRFKSSGVINSLGLAPLNVEEKRTNGSIIATTIEPDKNRAIISSQTGFLPYDPQAHDLVSLMVQLAILAQTQPQWQQAGTAHDFTVYRPSGIKRWRFQSFGLASIVLGEKQLETIYVRRVAIDSQADYESQYHFWLDLNHYGFPVKMRMVDAKNNVTDIQMVDWQEL